MALEVRVYDITDLQVLKQLLELVCWARLVRDGGLWAKQTPQRPHAYPGSPVALPDLPSKGISWQSEDLSHACGRSGGSRSTGSNGWAGMRAKLNYEDREALRI